jgi:hypothetical protein
MQQVRNTTLVCLSDIRVAESMYALSRTMRDFEFDEVLFFTSLEGVQAPPNVKIIKMLKGKFNSLTAYSRFVIKHLNNFIKSDHCMIVQHDGFPINPEKWTNEFLNYDYIGSPWPDPMPSRVGNGGFCIRSKKFMEIGARLATRRVKYEDAHLCRTNYHYLISQGIKFAPLELAMRWGVETFLPEFPMWTLNDSFGFHGLYQCKPFIIERAHIINEIRQSLSGHSG